jgi:AraC-like DNA-binding protein
MKDSGRLIHFIHEAMTRAGVDTNAVYFQLGFNPEYLNKPDLRTPHDAQIAFWEAVESVTGDPDIGLRLAPHLPTYSGDVIEYLFFSSPTFREGGRRAMKYLRLFSDALHAQIEERGGKAWMKVTTSGRKAPVLRHSEICITYGLVRFLKNVTDGAFSVEQVCLRMAKPAKTAPYEKLFGCRVSFDSEDSLIYFDRALFDRPSPHSEPELLRLHEELADRQLFRLASQDVVDEIKQVLAGNLEYENCDLESVARRLGRSPRRLRLELANAGTSFNQVLADFRYNMAKRLLALTDEPIERIVYLTGFSEISTFYRAFRRWSGKTPVQYRRDKKARLPAHHWAKGDAGAV